MCSVLNDAYSNIAKSASCDITETKIGRGRCYRELHPHPKSGAGLKKHTWGAYSGFALEAFLASVGLTEALTQGNEYICGLVYGCV